MQRQLRNLILLSIIYALVAVVQNDYGNSTSGVISDFVHYTMLGFFSAKYWALILIVSVGYDLITFDKDSLVAMISAKYVGLFLGVFFYKLYPFKIDLISIL